MVGVTRSKSQQVTTELRRQIESGKYQPAAELPSVAELSVTFGVSVGTVRAALAVLDAEGLTVARQGRPRMVAAQGRAGGLRYEQIADQLRTAIAAGVYAPGSPIPGELELAAMHDVSRATVQAAVRLLEQSGEVVARRGRRRVVAGATQASDALYEQVAAKLRAAIEGGRYRVDEKLPTEEELGQMYRVSRVTVRQALSVLRDAGLVESVPRSGSFVRRVD